MILKCKIPVCNYSVEPSIKITTENLVCLCLLSCYPEIDISVSKLLGFETFAVLVSENLVLEIKVSVSEIWV